MKKKVIRLSCMINGVNCVTQEPDKSIHQKMKEILENNDNYDYIDLVYHPNDSINMIEASLIVEINEPLNNG